VSKEAIFDLRTKRHEYNGASKGFIYLTKIGIGCVAPLAGWLVSLLHPVPMTWIIGVSFVSLALSKIVYYVRHPDRPLGWDDPLDWVCDTCLHFAWLGIWSALAGDLTLLWWLYLGWALTYPWSSE
jgi:hypothetical protein